MARRAREIARTLLRWRHGRDSNPGPQPYQGDGLSRQNFKKLAGITGSESRFPNISQREATFCLVRRMHLDAYITVPWSNILPEFQGMLDRLRSIDVCARAAADRKRPRITIAARPTRGSSERQSEGKAVIPPGAKALMRPVYGIRTAWRSSGRYRLLVTPPILATNVD